MMIKQQNEAWIVGDTQFATRREAFNFCRDRTLGVIVIEYANGRIQECPLGYDPDHGWGRYETAEETAAAECRPLAEVQAENNAARKWIAKHVGDRYGSR